LFPIDIPIAFACISTFRWETSKVRPIACAVWRSNDWNSPALLSVHADHLYKLQPSLPTSRPLCLPTTWPSM